MNNPLKVLYLMTSGKTGGIERLCEDISEKSSHENCFYFFWGGGACEEEIRKKSRTQVRNFSYFHLLGELSYFINFVKNNGFDVIVIQFPSPIIMLFSRIVSRHSKLVLYLHADPNALFDTRINKMMLYLIKGKLSGTIAISKFVKSEFFYDDVRVIYNGTNIKRFDYQKIEKHAEIKLIYIGRLVEEKGVQDILVSLKQINIPWKLTIVGTGNYEEKLKKLTTELCLDDKVLFTGEQKDVEKWLEGSDLFVHAARCKEGFGITLIEAMACGVPCVAYRKGAIPEIIEDYKNGFLVEDSDTKCFKEKLIDIINFYFSDFTLYSEICIRAREKAIEFSADAYINNLSNYLEEVCYED